MKKKLTLRMDQKAIAQAKAYARRRGTSVSKLVENFFVALEADETNSEIETSRLVRELAGIAADTDVSREDYYDHLEEKHR